MHPQLQPQPYGMPMDSTLWGWEAASGYPTPLMQGGGWVWQFDMPHPQWQCTGSMHYRLGSVGLTVCARTDPGQTCAGPTLGVGREHPLPPPNLPPARCCMPVLPQKGLSILSLSCPTKPTPWRTLLGIQVSGNDDCSCLSMIQRGMLCYQMLHQ